MSDDSGVSPAGGPSPSSSEADAVLRVFPDLLIRLDIRGNVLEVKVGAGEGGATPERRSALLAQHVSSSLLTAAARAITTQELVSIEYPAEVDGVPQHFEARVAPVLGTQAVAFIRDITARRLAAQELFTSREMLRSILNTIPQRVFWKDRNSVYLGCNRRLANDCGFSDPAQIVGRTDFDIEAKETALAYRADDAEVLKNNQPKLNFEVLRDRGDGDRRWWRASKVPLHDESGHGIGVLGTYDDVTEQKTSEMLHAGHNRILELILAGTPLRETLNQLARLMETLSPGMHATVLLMDSDGRRLRSYVAPSLSAEFTQVVDGLTVEEGFGSCGTAAARKSAVIVTEIRGDPLWERYKEFGERFAIRACWSMPIFGTGQTVLGTFAMYFRRPRKPTPAELHLIEVAGHVAGIAIERKQVEESLRNAEEKYRKIFENAIDGIFQISPDGKILEANPAFARLFGATSPAALVSVVDDVQQQLCGEPARYDELVHALRLYGMVHRWEMPMRRLDGQPLWVCIDARLACAPDGQPLCYEGVATDVTERKRLEQQFLQAQKMEALGQLAGGIAHDFNNLLTVILGNLSLVQLDSIPAAQRHTALDDSIRAAERAAALTRQLLTFSRRNRSEVQSVDLNEVVADVGKMLSRLIGEHITLSTRLAPGGAPVRIDRGMIEQAVMNLALNSRDAMPSGGTLNIALSTVKFDAAAALTGRRTRTGEFVQLTVTDDGSGIAPEHLPHIFEPFFTTKEIGKGTGLGLAMVFGIVEQHEGWIDVESPPGGGTRIQLFFPRVAAVQPPPPAPVAVAKPRGGTETILMVEDEGDVRTLMSRVLERHGYRVHAASSGVEALELWPTIRHEVHLLVTDMVMPGGVGGRELAEKLTADRPDLKVIFCTGYTEEVLGTTGPLRRREDFLEKPFDIHVFLERVRDRLDTALE